MPLSPVTSAFNDAYIAEMYERFRADAPSVDESWRQFFRTAEALAGAGGERAGAPRDAAYLRKVAGAAMLVDAIRDYGHLAVPLDPLGGPPVGAAELQPEFHGIAERDLDEIPAGALDMFNRPDIRRASIPGAGGPTCLTRPIIRAAG